MNNQYHCEQESSLLRESAVDQAARFFTHDWEITNDQIDSFSDPLKGKIIAQMPDLGECRTISEARRSQQQSGNWLNRIYSGFAVISHFPKRLWQILPSIKFRNFPFSFIRQQKFYSNLIVICLIVCIIGGGVLIYKGNKKKWKEAANPDVAQNSTQIEKAETSAAAEKSATTPATTEKKPATPSPTASVTAEKKPATPSPTASATAEKKPATPSPTASATAEKKPATPSPTASATAEKKPATPLPTASATAEKKPAIVPVATVGATASKVSESKNRNNVNSPWERSATDSYSPWTKTTQSHLEATEVESVGVSTTTSVNSVSPVPNPSVPLVPMSPILPNQPEIPVNTAVNNSTNNSVNPVNNTVPIANNATPVVNNVVPVINNPVYNNVPITNNPVPPPFSVAQRELPYSPNANGANANGVVTVYSQHNVPVSQDYMATYGRVNIPPVPSSVQPQPVYPPQPYNGQPLQNPSGQYPQIVPPTYSGTPTANHITMPIPMHGVAPQPQPVPMTGTSPIPIQPIAPVQGTAPLPIPQEIIPSPAIPIGMVPPAGTMPMSQPIPTQMITSIPPTYHSSSAYSSYPVPSSNVPVSPSYYPPAVAVPYYQQGNTNTSVPYRRLY
jgi:hypothetical protein